MKLPLPHDPPHAHEILVSRKRNFKVYAARIKELFHEKEMKCVILQGTGAAVDRTVELALNSAETYKGLSYEIETFTIPVEHLTMDEF